jgi:hypothetical protein
MLWLGTHPVLAAVRKPAVDPTAISPAQVLRVDPETGDASEIFTDPGTLISGSSVAARWRDRLLVGQIFGDGILDCRLAGAPEAAAAATPPAAANTEAVGASD